MKYLYLNVEHSGFEGAPNVACVEIDLTFVTLMKLVRGKFIDLRNDIPKVISAHLEINQAVEDMCMFRYVSNLPVNKLPFWSEDEGIFNTTPGSKEILMYGQRYVLTPTGIYWRAKTLGDEQVVETELISWEKLFE